MMEDTELFFPFDTLRGASLPFSPSQGKLHTSSTFGTLTQLTDLHSPLQDLCQQTHEDLEYHDSSKPNEFKSLMFRDLLDSNNGTNESDSGNILQSPLNDILTFLNNEDDPLDAKEFQHTVRKNFTSVECCNSERLHDEIQSQNLVANSHRKMSIKSEGSQPDMSHLPILQIPLSRRKVQYRKTRLCPWFFSGRCVMGEQCNYAHSQSEIRGRPDLTRTKICPDMSTCTDPTCRFAHYSTELRATGAFYKTKICKFWQRGFCTAGAACRHAHGIEQLREPDEDIQHRKACVTVPSSLSNVHRHNSLNLGLRCDEPLSQVETSAGYLTSQATSRLSLDTPPQESLNTVTQKDSSLNHVLTLMLLEQASSALFLKDMDEAYFPVRAVNTARERVIHKADDQP